MNISIFGLGYVGCVSMGCLASMKHRIIGVDKNKEKVELINKGEPTILEPGLKKIIKKAFREKLITATEDYKYAVKNSEISFICIGTPGLKNGKLNLRCLLNGVKQISDGLKFKTNFHTIVIRSTVNPGSFEKILAIAEKISGKKHLIDFCIIINPEFLREGSAVQDFFEPPINIIGSGCKKGVDLLKKIYRSNKAPTEVVPESIAEMIKLVSNSFHCVKISFANEIGYLCKKLGIDSHLIMKLFCEDKKLNISSMYLKPGFAYGGSCLHKDITATKKIAEDNKLKIPLITGAGISNKNQIENTLNLVKSFGVKKIGIWGLSFKIGTDDMRGSPIIDIANNLIKDGYEVMVYDQNVDLHKIIGSNKEYINKHFKIIDKIFAKDFNKLLEHSKILIINSYDVNFIKLIKKYKTKIILDLNYIPELRKMEKYKGICW